MAAFFKKSWNSRRMHSTHSPAHIVTLHWRALFAP